MHLPAKHVRKEMLSLQQLTRACLSHGEGGRLEPTLVVKTKSLYLKYLIKASTIRFLFGRTQARNLIYGLLIDGDAQSPLGVWSVVERDDELRAVKRIVAGERFTLAMFNEAVANICGGFVTLHERTNESLFQDIRIASKNQFEKLQPEVDDLFEEWHAHGTGLRVLSSDANHEWRSAECVYVTNQLRASRIDFLHSDEGGQQEELAAWIVDELHLNGVFQNPIAAEATQREFCDLLFTHQFGTILFESKALAVLARADLPEHEKLRNDIAKHIQKALRQLAGACKNLRGGTPILDRNKSEINVNRLAPPQCVILIPDLNLIDSSKSAVLNDVADFASKTKAFINIVDPSQLFSLMMDANNVSRRGQATSPLMAFDYLLMRRFESVIRSRDPGVITLCRFNAAEAQKPARPRGRF